MTTTTGKDSYTPPSNRGESEECFTSEDEKGATLVEYVLALACIALILMTGIPEVEENVTEQLDKNATIWTDYEIDGI